MKYFTPERYTALQDCSSDSAMDRADAEWEKVVAEYDAYVRTSLPSLPSSVRRLTELYLHDADILSISCEGDNFVVLLQLEALPRELLTLSFSLIGQPDINRSALSPDHRSSRPQWLHEEIEVVDAPGEKCYRLSLLLSNGWEVRIPFRDIRMTFAQPVFPAAGTALPVPHPELK